MSIWEKYASICMSIWEKSWAKYGGYWIFGSIALIGSLAGGLAWFTHYIASLANTPNQQQVISPIDLAGVTATFGGLILVGAFYKGKGEHATNEEKEHTMDLKLIGKLTLLSAVCFIITYFLLQYVSSITSPNLSPNDWFFVVTTDVAAITAVLSLSAALSFLVTIIRFI